MKKVFLSIVMSVMVVAGLEADGPFDWKAVQASDYRQKITAALADEAASVASERQARNEASLVALSEAIEAFDVEKAKEIVQNNAHILNMIVPDPSGQEFFSPLGFARRLSQLPNLTPEQRASVNEIIRILTMAGASRIVDNLDALLAGQAR